MCIFFERKSPGQAVRVGPDVTAQVGGAGSEDVRISFWRAPTPWFSRQGPSKKAVVPKNHGFCVVLKKCSKIQKFILIFYELFAFFFETAPYIVMKYIR